MTEKRKRGEGTPETAFEEVLRETEEAEEAETSGEKRDRRGEAGDAITPNVRAQEESGGE